jgi:hypothetical protein
LGKSVPLGVSASRHGALAAAAWPVRGYTGGGDGGGGGARTDLRRLGGDGERRAAVSIE